MTSASASANATVALKSAFEAFGILYYPLFATRAELACEASDDDMAWAVTALANLDGTGYTLSQASIMVLAAYHHAMVSLANATSGLPLARAAAPAWVDPLADIRRLVPDVTATPFYPDFPQQVMEMSEAQFRYDQAMHYASTYGVELVSGLMGLDVTVGKGWMPKTSETPKVRDDQALVAAKVLHVVMTVEDMRGVVAARLGRATRLQDSELDTVLAVFADLGADADPDDFPTVAFHENMMRLIAQASLRGSATLEHVASCLSQHPGDLLKAIASLREVSGGGHLTTVQKKGLCRAFERFEPKIIAQNIADADRTTRFAPHYLSLARFAGPNLREGVRLYESGEVRSWYSRVEALWTPIIKAGHASAEEWQRLLELYGQRPGVLLRSTNRLAKSGCPAGLLNDELQRHAQHYSLPTIVRTLTLMSNDDQFVTSMGRYGEFKVVKKNLSNAERRSHATLVPTLRLLLSERLDSLDTPLRGRRVYLDKAGISLEGTILMPNETGDTATAWPPVGVALELPPDKTVRFFTFWDDREERVDVDLHFVGKKVDGQDVRVGWSSDFRAGGMVTSGDVTTSEDAVEFLDADIAAARKDGVDFVVQQQHIFAGAQRWGDIGTCYSGAAVVADTSADVRLVDPKNLIFRDDLTGSGKSMSYAVVSFTHSYVRIMRGANLPLGNPGFSLRDYLETLFEAQGVTLVEDPADAELSVCVGRSDDPEVISLFDEGFFVG